METIKIKGRDYIQVNERIKFFRSSEDYKGWSIETELLKYDGTNCMIRATVKDQTGRIMATGLDCESTDSNPINSNALVMNVETGAVGRALGFLGIGIDTSIASAEEVEHAINKQEVQPQQEVKQADIVMLQDAQGQPVQYKHCFSKNRNQYFWALVNPADEARSKKYISDADMKKILGD